MRRNPIGGYQGPVTILTSDDDIVAQAACRYRAEEDSAGVDHWSGRLHRIAPADAITAGTYRLRFDSGHQGEIVIAAVPPGSRVIDFEGVGDRPL
jgi:hypothetical protein